jgi:hypothetical protein
MFKILLITALVTVTSGTLTIGLHYTSSQGGDRTLDINVNTVLKDNNGWDNNLSRFKITGEETWEFYDNPDFMGEPLFTIIGPVDWTRVDSIDRKMNDKVSSVKMSGSLYIGLHYTDRQGGDRVLEINGPQNLEDMNNNLSRFKIPGAETWEFYDNVDYAGEPLFTKTGPLDWTRVDSLGAGSGKLFNDKVSSVKPAGSLVRIITDDGEPLDTGAGSFTLPAGGKVKALKGDYTCTAN